MSPERWSYVLAAVLLAVAGMAVAAYRQAFTGIPLLPDEERRVWLIEARIEFIASGEPTEVLLTLPPEQDGFEVLSEPAGASSGFGFTVDRAGPQERAHWTKRSASGRQILFCQMDLAQDPQHRIIPEAPDEASAAYFEEPHTTAAAEVLNDFLPKSTGAKSLADQLVQAINTEPLSQNMRLLRQGRDAAPLIVALLSRAGTAARTVKALQLEDGRRHQPLHDYVQVWHEGDWLLYDPELGRLDETTDLLLWQTGTSSVFDVVGGSRSQVSFSMTSQTHSALSLSRQRTSPFDLLHNLPIAEQGMFKLIMTLPVGALVVVFMRLVVGIRTSGTFMPILIALTFLQTELLAGMIGLVVVVGAALLLRSYLSSLNLLLVARIATLVVVVIALVLVLAVVSYRLGLISGLAITFFPMVILAWTVERMSILWEEEGAGEALIQGAGSLLVAVCAYAMMSLSLVRHLAFNFPELILVVLAGILLLGRYTGYRVSELLRFLPLTRTDPK